MASLIDKYSKEELKNIVSESFSFAEVLSKLGYSTVNGRNSNTLKIRLKYYDISTSHFLYKSSRRIITDEEVFCENSKVSQSTLRKRFIKKNIVPYKCDICGQEPFWNKKPLVLTLDHKNGKNKDNRYENLRWVCPNCDRQLDTYGNKNKKNLEKGVVLFHRNDANINNNKKRIEVLIPDRKELKDKLWELKNYTQVANYYNVSTTQIRRWCRNYNLPSQISIIKHTSENGWINENWNDSYKENVYKAEKSIPCRMMDISTNEIIKEFSSRKEACRYLGLNSRGSIHIGRACNGERETAYGYKWSNII